MTVLYYIRSGGKLLTGVYRWRDFDDDGKNLKLFAECVTGKDPDQLLESIKKGLPVGWRKTYDVVNPFGDARSDGLESVWLFDLETDTLFLRKRDGFCSASLSVARQRELNMANFTAVSSPDPTDHIDQLNLDETWVPNFECISETKSLPRKILRDFVYTWRHVLRRQQNDTTFSRLAHAVMSIATLKLSVVERSAFDHSPEYPWVSIEDLPQWDIPNNNIFRAGASSFVLTQDVLHGVDLVRQHIKTRNADEKTFSAGGETYAILTLRHIVVCRVGENGLEWTRPEVFFSSEETLSDRAVDMLLWAARSSPAQTMLHKLPIEIQDKILYLSHASSIAAASGPIAPAILGCQLGLGSPYMRGDRENCFELEPRKRKRMRYSPYEWKMHLAEGFTGVSYKTIWKRQAPTS
ncbi:hypothetical protein NM208_g6399 [Fusarium decemcellulare]|uniref:Uncharacterized protein n=1 Tax=Fusarium decemcellulare TaxID=57161 RepID=A0ACC1SD85_9HYPO|nr:hypothetical protein NM208_g6399 [Fusarium decemcellulare]